MHVLSALGPAPDGVIGAVDLFITDRTLVGEGLASAGVRAGRYRDWSFGRKR